MLAQAKFTETSNRVINTGLGNKPDTKTVSTCTYIQCCGTAFPMTSFFPLQSKLAQFSLLHIENIFQGSYCIYPSLYKISEQSGHQCPYKIKISHVWHGISHYHHLCIRFNNQQSLLYPKSFYFHFLQSISEIEIMANLI